MVLPIVHSLQKDTSQKITYPYLLYYRLQKIARGYPKKNNFFYKIKKRPADSGALFGSQPEIICFRNCRSRYICPRNNHRCSLREWSTKYNSYPHSYDGNPSRYSLHPCLQFFRSYKIPLLPNSAKRSIGNFFVFY